MAEEGKPPLVRIVARPRDAVHWTLYYPPILPPGPSEPPPGVPGEWQSRVSRLLAVGRVDEAGAEIGEVLKKAPGDSTALALQSVIAVAQNDKENAQALGRKAVETDPRSASAWIALSYAQQAGFDLAGARTSVEEAVRLEPGNALAWARLSELRMSSGNLDEALEAANRAASLDPGLARAQSVLGFAYLAQVHLKASREAFEKAIVLDQADPLPRLGLGLARIREGDLAGGRTEIEIAASLAPNNSLIRSYLGKAYYEEKRDKPASSQLGMAKELDPNDPTPWFYDAIRKQTLNRPVEALQDLQRSISLNGNRAVYRSRLLLDDDLAARSASLGRIYDDLGFQQLALVEGWKSVNTDPANYSAHRFLADSYAALPRHEIARVSELLQSQLLQPLNVNPVQPSLAQKNLSILESAGPSSPSFNEFNPLFLRNRLALQASGVAGSQETFGEEVVLSGLQNRFSYSLGQFHFQTDGFRENNDQTQNIYNVFAQASLSHKTSVLAEYRAFDVDQGDLELRFLPDDFFRNLAATRTSSKAGGSAFTTPSRPGPTSSARRSTSLHKYSARVNDQFPFDVGVVLNLDVNDQTVDHVANVELQQIVRRGRYHLVAGAGYLHINRDETLSISSSTDPPVFPPDDPGVSFGQHRAPHQRLPVSQRAVPGKRDLDVGRKRRLLPGFGRRFRYQGPQPVQPETRGDVDPPPRNHAAGRGLPGAAAHAAVHQPDDRADPGGGLQPVLRRLGRNGRLDVRRRRGPEDHGFPVRGAIVFPERPRRAEIQHRSAGSAYLPTVRLEGAPGAGLCELGTRSAARVLRRLPVRTPRPGSRQVKEVTTHRVPLSARFFHPSGVFATATGSWFDQSGQFFRIGQAPTVDTPESGSDQFWIFDASAGYRLPKGGGSFRSKGRTCSTGRSSIRTRTRSARSSSPGARCISS